jgi:hypothetical protein
MITYRKAVLSDAKKLAEIRSIFLKEWKIVEKTEYGIRNKTFDFKKLARE